MEGVTGGVPEEYINNSSTTEKTDTPPSSETRVPLRTETVHKQGYSLEKNYYEPPNGIRSITA